MGRQKKSAVDAPTNTKKRTSVSFHDMGESFLQEVSSDEGGISNDPGSDTASESEFHSIDLPSTSSRVYTVLSPVTPVHNMTPSSDCTTSDSQTTPLSTRKRRRNKNSPATVASTKRSETSSDSSAVPTTSRKSVPRIKETVRRANFELPTPWGQHFQYVGHNKTRQSEWEKEGDIPISQSEVRCGYFVKCLYCYSRLSSVDGVKARLSAHIKKCNAKVYEAQLLKDKGSIQDCPKYPPNHPTQVRWQRVMLRGMVSAGLPFWFTQNPDMAATYTFLDPLIRVLGPGTWRKKLFDVAENEIYPHLFRELQRTSEVGFVCDSWSTCKNEAVLCTQVVWMTDDDTIQLRTLAAERLTGTHSAESIRALVVQQLKDYNLENKCIFTTTDYGSNMVKAFQLQGTADASLFHEEFSPIFCYAHRIHNVVKAVKRVHALIQDVTTQTKFIRKGQDTAEAFATVADRSLVRPVKTRWNSYYDMLKQFSDVEVFRQVQKIISGCQLLRDTTSYSRVVPDTFGDDDFSTITELVALLKPLAFATDKIQSDSYESSEVLPVITGVFMALTEFTLDTSAASSLRAALMHYMIHDFQDHLNDSYLNTLTLLNPFYKLRFYNYYHTNYPHNPLGLLDGTTVVSCLEASYPALQRPVPAANTLPMTNGAVYDIRHIMSQDCDEDVSDSSRSELQSYLANKHKPDTTKKNYVQIFWTENKKDYPTLYSIFRKTFIRRSSSASVERTFSLCGRLNNRRRLTKVETLEKLVMVHENSYVLTLDDAKIETLRSTRHCCSRPVNLLFPPTRKTTPNSSDASEEDEDIEANTSAEAVTEETVAVFYDHEDENIIMGSEAIRSLESDSDLNDNNLFL